MTGNTISNANNNSSSNVNDSTYRSYNNMIDSVSVNVHNGDFIDDDIIVSNSSDNFTKSDSFSALFNRGSLNKSTSNNPENYEETNDAFSPQTNHSPTEHSPTDHFSDRSEKEVYFMSLMRQRNKSNKKKLKKRKAPDWLVSTSLP